jgi:hypothetical protein
MPAAPERELDVAGGPLSPKLAREAEAWFDGLSVEQKKREMNRRVVVVGSPLHTLLRARSIAPASRHKSLARIFRPVVLRMRIVGRAPRGRRTTHRRPSVRSLGSREPDPEPEPLELEAGA